MVHWQNLLYLKTIWRVLKPKPKYFYKYHSINPFLTELLEKSSFWASKASVLNDHYDSNFVLTKSFIKKEYLDSIKAEEIDISLPAKQFETAKEILLSLFDEKLLSNWQQDYRSNLGVCCFTSTPLSELMWAHYADSAKGVCLQFSFKQNPDFERKIVPIRYSNKQLRVKDKIDRFKALFKKRMVWQYEKEWRVLTCDKTLPFNKGDLIGITFGPKTNMDDAERIKELCKKNDYDVIFTFCHYKNTGLEIVPFDF